MQAIELHYSDEIKYFDTIKEAQEFASRFINEQEFAIYTLHMSGTREGINWKLQLDTATNLRAVPKARAGQNWNDREIETLGNSLKAKQNLKAISTALGRSYHATYCKAVKHGFIKPKQKKK